jgi:hypothetical protein
MAQISFISCDRIRAMRSSHNIVMSIQLSFTYDNKMTGSAVEDMKYSSLKRLTCLTGRAMETILTRHSAEPPIISQTRVQAVVAMTALYEDLIPRQWFRHGNFESFNSFAG